MIPNLLKIHQSDEVVIAQLDALKRRVPILYVVLIVETVALSITHRGIAHPALSLYAPILICAFMAMRTVYWLRLRGQATEADAARRQLLQTTKLAIALALLIPAWALFLYINAGQHGSSSSGIDQQGHVVVYVGLAAITCAALLMHSHGAALLVAFFVSGPFCLYMLFAGTVVEVAVSVTLMLAISALLYVLFAFSEEFEQLVQSRFELRALSNQQSHFANTDALTNLSSRRHFLHCFDQVLQTDRSFALLMIDLDGFKQINDLYGHMVGDDVLAEIGRRLREVMTDDHCLARVGGDEFAVIHSLAQPDRLQELGETLVRVCSRPVPVQGYLVVKIGASIGVSIADGAQTREARSTLIERADYALSHVKHSGKGRVQIFDPAHEHAVRRIGQVEQALRSAQLAQEIELAFQPVVTTRSSQLLGFEALARWTSPVLGQVSPAEFVPAAERAGIIGSLTLVVIEKALRQASLWPEHVGLKINLSAYDVSSSHQMLRIIAAVNASGVDPARLTFELTETAFANDLDTVKTSVEMIKTLGASLAIDDFGTGYSSLSYVHRFGPDLIKIDRSFIARLDQDDGSQAIIKSIVELCRNIGARSLAEGVETEAQARILKELGIDEMQGYLFGRPKPAREIERNDLAQGLPQAA